MMDFTLMFIVTITTLVLLNFSPSAYCDTYVNLTAILSAPGAPFLSFLSLIQTENVIQVLEQQGNTEPGLTLFVPNDVAIARDNVSWGDLSLAQVQALLLFHAIPQYFNATATDLSALSQISPVLTMAGLNITDSGFTLNFSFVSVSDTLYLNSGWTKAEVLSAVNLTTYPTEIYQIDKVLMPEGIFGTNIPTPSSTSASTAPSASTTSTPNKNESGTYPPLKSGTGSSVGVIAGVSVGGVMGALLVAAVCIKCGFYRKKKEPDEFSISKRAEEKRLQSGSESTVSRDKNFKTPDGESLQPNQPQGSSDGDKNTNTGGGVATGKMSIEGDVSLGKTDIRVGTTNLHVHLPAVASTNPEVLSQSGTHLLEVVDRLG